MSRRNGDAGGVTPARTVGAVWALIVALCLGAAAPHGAWRHDVDRSDFIAIGARPEFSAVARLVQHGTTEHGGSGVLIHPRWVLTAAHVVDRWVPGDDDRWEWGSVSAGIEDVVLHPSYLGATSLDGRVDLALVRLDATVSDVVPAVLHEAGREQGRRVALVGFGTAQPANTLGGAGEQTPPGTKYAGFNVLDSLAPLHSFLDMDAPHTEQWNVMGDAAADPQEYMPLGGDSGGGVFAQFEGRWELVGVMGTIAMDMAQLMDHGWYGQVVRLNRVSPQMAWVEAVLGSPPTRSPR